LAYKYNTALFIRKPYINIYDEQHRYMMLKLCKKLYHFVQKKYKNKK